MVDKLKWGAAGAGAGAVVVVIAAIWAVLTTGEEPVRVTGQTSDDTVAAMSDETTGQSPDTQTQSGESDAPTKQEDEAQTAEAAPDDAGEADAAPQSQESAGDGSAARTAADTQEGETVQGEQALQEEEMLQEEETLQEEAEAYVEQLAQPSDESMPMEKAEGFMGADRPLTAADPGSEAQSPLQPEAEAVDETAATGAEVAEAGSPQPQVPATGDESAAEPEPTVAEPEAEPGSETSDAGAESVGQTSVDLPVSEQAPVTIARLLAGEEVVASDAVFYVHTVQPSDNQGIWGIVHHGIVENFARGIAVHRGESTETYRVEIPRDADERAPDSSSSFLGKLIYEKSRQSYVYNYRTDRLGQDPDLILPGQEIVIVSFTPEELIAVYKHFVRKQERSS